MKQHKSSRVHTIYCNYFSETPSTERSMKVIKTLITSCFIFGAQIIPAIVCDLRLASRSRASRRLLSKGKSGFTTKHRESTRNKRLKREMNIHGNRNIKSKQK